MEIADYEKTDLSRYSILIIDDIALNATLLKKALSRFNFTVSVATSGLEALESTMFNKPTIILLDIMMPGMDGFAFLEEFRKDPSNEKVKVIMVSAAANADSIGKSARLGANDFITKPISFPKLYAAIFKQIESLQTEA